MELKEFITTAITEIIGGVLDAQEVLGANKKHVNPRVEGGAVTTRMQASEGRMIESVEFDVAVTVTTGKGAKGGIGVVAGPFAIGSQAHSNAENIAVSRLKFSVPITLPYGEAIKQR